MSNLSLRLHPNSSSPVTRIEADVARIEPNMLFITYWVFGDLARVAVPPTRTAARNDELWKHTCLEAFVAAEHGYYEFNFAPSSQWAAYRFDSHRLGMHDAPAHDPAIKWRLEDGVGKMSATLRLPPDARGPLGLSAIVEDKQGTRSFWALAHPPGDPDFHHPACFAAQLPPAD